MKVLGIDPGTATTGYGVVREYKNRIHTLDYGCIYTKPKTSMPYRLKHIYKELSDLIIRYSPDVIAVEQLFFNRNVKTALLVGQARGVILVCGANSGLKVCEYTPLQVKQAVVGYGRASKKQIQRMLKVLLNLDKEPTPDDAADALAVGICHIHSAGLDGKLSKSW